MSELHRIAGCENPDRAADIVFMHGLGGDPLGTWEAKAGSWPHWVGEDFPQVGVWSLGYGASPFKLPRLLGMLSPRFRKRGHAMPLPERALEVLHLFVHREIGQRPLMFVCHSLGGLLAKQILRRAMDSRDERHQAIATNTRAVVFLGTPHAGAALATMLDRFRGVFGTTVAIEDLRAHDAHLSDLHEWYRTNAAELGIETVAFYETQGVRNLLTIVDPTSAHPGVGPAPVGLGEDHLSIAKPETRESRVFDAVADLLRRHVLVLRPERRGEENAGPHAHAALRMRAPAPPEVLVKVEHTSAAAQPDRRIPCELPPQAAQFFGRQTELARLTERLRYGKDTDVVGPGGMGKTAVAAEAVRAVVGASGVELAASPYRDGVVFLDLYALRAEADAVWSTLANKVAGADFRERSPARERATEACRARRILVIIEGGEEADGKEGRVSIADLLSVLSPENVRLLLTRFSSQADPARTIWVNESLDPEDAARLFDSLTGDVPDAVRARVLSLLNGHPLALTWAGGLLARGDEDPGQLAHDWEAESLPSLNDPVQSRHTLQWLFDRTARGLDNAARDALNAAGLLARAPFPLAAVQAALGDDGPARAREALRILVQHGFLRRVGTPESWEFTHVLGYGFARDESGSDPGMLDRLARWVHSELARLIRPGEDPSPVAGVLEHTMAITRADAGHRLWNEVVEFALYDVADRIANLGRLDLVLALLAGVADWLDRLAPDRRATPKWLRESAVLARRRGDAVLVQGDLPGALRSYQDDLEVAQRLAAADPSNAGWQRDLSVSLERIGDVLLAQGDLPGALRSHQKALNARQRLAAADPSNAGWQRDLSVSLIKIGDVLLAQGDLPGALRSYQEDLEVAQRLAAADPSNAIWERDLGVSLEKIGNVLLAKGDLPGALRSYQEGLNARQRLAAADPSNAGWQRDLSVSLNKIGDVLRAQGDLPGALRSYQETLNARQRLAAADPSNAGWQRDLCVSLERVGNVHLAEGDLPSALRSHQEALNARQRLAAADPSNAEWQRDLSVSLNNIGDVLVAQGDLPGALRCYQKDLEVAQRLAAADPSNAGWQRDLSISLSKIGNALGAQGNLPGALRSHQEALNARQRLAAADPSNAGWQRDLSFSFTTLAELYQRLGNMKEALRLAEEGLAIDERLAMLDSTNATWQKDVRVSRALVARLHDAREGRE